LQQWPFLAVVKVTTEGFWKVVVEENPLLYTFGETDTTVFLPSVILTELGVTATLEPPPFDTAKADPPIAIAEFAEAKALLLALKRLLLKVSLISFIMLERRELAGSGVEKILEAGLTTTTGRAAGTGAGLCWIIMIGRADWVD
jgi:hypothetical protein